MCQEIKEWKTDKNRQEYPSDHYPFTSPFSWSSILPLQWNKEKQIVYLGRKTEKNYLVLREQNICKNIENNPPTPTHPPKKPSKQKHTHIKNPGNKKAHQYVLFITFSSESFIFM